MLANITVFILLLSEISFIVWKAPSPQEWGLQRMSGEVLAFYFFLKSVTKIELELGLLNFFVILLHPLNARCATLQFGP